MKILEAIHPDQAKRFSTEELRENFLLENLFKTNEISLYYTYYDRMIVGGVLPTKKLELSIDKKIIGTEHLLDRREMGLINIGQKGIVTADGIDYELENGDCLYLGMGTKSVGFQSENPNNPAKFYLLCTPAHRIYPTVKTSLKDAEPLHLGSIEGSNERTIYKYIHPDGVKSCQLVMGMTLLEKNNVWNTMPSHTHPRRMEVYFYFDIPDDHVVFQILGQPDQTRHIVTRNEQALLHPSWSMHSGVGTSNYSFIWGMAGENQTFSDMDLTPMTELM